MKRFLHESQICSDFIASCEDAMKELHERGWSVGHAVFDDVHQVSGYKGKMSIVANAPTELDAWILACVKANEQEKLKRHRN